jgi:hypothetical protein
MYNKVLINDNSYLTDDPEDMYRTPKRIIKIRLSCPPPVVRNIRYSQNNVSDARHIENNRIVPTIRRLRFDSDSDSRDGNETHDYGVSITSIA